MSNEDFIAFGKPSFDEQEIEAVSKVLRSGWVSMGPETQAFEKELAEYVGSQYVVAVNSGTSALFLALKALGVGPGDEVLVPTLTWCSTANVALYLGAKPVFCDVDPKTMCISKEEILEKTNPNTKAVMVVHYGGYAMDVQALKKALPSNLPIIEDAAHALGASYPDGSSVGSSGNLCCFSFYANKNLSTGEGGAIAVNDKSLAEKMMSLRLHGLPIEAWKRFSDPKANIIQSTLISELGYKLNYTDLQACIGRVQLKKQSEFNKKRAQVAEYYETELKSQFPGIEFPLMQTHSYHAKHLFIVMLPLHEMKMDRNEFILRMRERRIGVALHYRPLHLMPLYQDIVSGRFPVADKIFDRIVTLPIGPNVGLTEAKKVVSAMIETLKT